MYIQYSDLVTPTENINIDSDNISEGLRVYATQLKEVEPYKTVIRGEPIIQEKPIYVKVLQNSGNMELSIHLLQ